jgi:hypothetical protein
MSVINFDFDSVPDMDDFSTLPEGDYSCELESVEEKNTRAGDEMWSLKFRVLNEEYENRIIFDNMVFSDNEKAQQRVKLICSRLGLNTKGRTTLSPDMIEGKQCIISVIETEYIDAAEKTKRRNEVEFSGYKTIEKEGGNSSEGNSENEDDNIPF